MGKGSGGTNTVVQNSQPPQQVMNAYGNVLAQAQALSQQPLQQYGGNMIAGFTPQQLAAFQEINQAQGSALPYINTASQYAGIGAAPVFPNVMQYNSSNLQNFIDPYTQQVTGSLQNLFNTQNQEQQNQLVGNAISAGAWGGDRASVAQAQLARQQQLAQNPQLAQVLQQGFGQAQQTLSQQQQLQLQGMEGDAWRAANAAYQFGGLGNQVQSSLLGGASSLLQAGGLGQQLAQEGLNIPYEQFTAQQAYPFQDLSWLSQISTGLGSGMGGTSSTTSPGVSTLGQLGGLGLTGLGIAGQAGAFNGLGSQIGSLFGGGGYTGALAAGTSAGGALTAAELADLSAAGVSDAAIAAVAAGAAARGGRVKDAYAFGGHIRGGTNIIPFPRQNRGFGMHFDDGGGVASNPGAGPPIGLGAGPLTSGILNRYRGMSTEQLQRLAIMSPPSTAQGQIIQRLLQARHMAPASTTPQQQPMGLTQPQSGFGMLPANDNATPQPMAARGGRFAGGGTAGPSSGPDVSTIMVGDSANPMPVTTTRSTIASPGYGVPIPQMSFSVDPSTGNTPTSFWNPHSGWTGAPAQPLTATGTGFGGSNPTGASSGASSSAPIVTPLPAAVTNAAANYAAAQAAAGAPPPLQDIQPSALTPEAISQVTNSPGYGGMNMTPEQQQVYMWETSPLNPSNQRGGANARGGRISSGGGVLEENQGERFDEGGEVDEDAPDVNVSAPGNPSTGFGSPSIGGAGNRPVFQPSPTSQFLSSPWGALTAAGAGMLASRSPHAGVALGEGLERGLGFATKQAQEADRRAFEEGQIGVAQDRLHYEQSKPTINSAGDSVRLIYQDGRIIDTGIPTAAWKGKEAAEKHYGTIEDIERQRLHQEQERIEQGHFTWQPWQQPDPNDPSKIVTGMMRVSSKPGEGPTFFPSSGAPLPKDGSGVGMGTTPPADLHGDDYLKTLPGNQANQVKALAEGRMAFPTGFALKSPYWQSMLSAVSQYDPSFDAVNYGARSKTRNDFTAGKSAQNLTSINTAIGHLGTLADAADKLNNSSYDTINKVANWFETRTGDPRVNNFNVAKNAVADELTRVFRGTGGSEAEIDRWTNTINAAQSPAQLHGAVKQAVDLLHSRINAVGETYDRGMGTSTDHRSLLSTKAQETLQKLDRYGEEHSSSSAATAPARGAAAAPTLPDAARAQLQEGRITTFANGQRWTLRNGTPEQVP